MNKTTGETLRIILLAEDEELLRKSIDFTLRRQGFKVLQAATVDDAIRLMSDICNEEKLCLIITDLQLPVKNGFELISYAKQNAPKVPILVITGHRGRDERIKLARLGITAVLDKPFDITDLMDRVEFLISTAKRENTYW